MAKHNIVNTGTIWGITNQVIPDVAGPSGVYLTVGPELTGRIKKVNTLLVTNASTTTDYEASIYNYIALNNGSAAGTAWLAQNVVVPAKSTMVIVSSDNPVYVEEDGYLAGYSNVVSTLQFTISYEVIF